jgi:RNA polymerase sigma factor (sigma-70 family)
MTTDYNKLDRDAADLALWIAFKSGNSVAFEKILKCHYAGLFRYASRFSKNRVVVEDCIQDVFVYIWEHREGLGHPASVKFYLLKAVRHRMILELKHPLPPVESLNYLYPAEDNIERQLIANETQHDHSEQLASLVQALPARQKEALYLKYYEELKVEEIGEMMGVSRQSAANFLFRAITSLRSNWIYRAISLIFATLCS